MTLPERKTARFSGTRLDYREAGQGPVIFLLHGMNGQSGTWVYQLQSLSDNYRVIAWDAPGYGESAVCDGSITDFAQRTADFLESIGAEKPLVVGHSMGGVIAGRLAIDFEERLSGLVLSCSHAGWALPAGSELSPRYAKRIEERIAMSDEDYANLRASKMVGPDTPDEIRFFLGEMSLSATVEGIRTVGQSNQQADNLPGLSRLRLPSYILSAELDTVIKPERTSALRKAMPDAEYIVLEGVGHAPYIENPDGYNDLLRRIADSVFSV